MNELRPTCLDEIVGNNNLKKCIRITIDSTRKRNGIFPHSIFNGFRGCGKSTFAHVLANELGCELIEGHGGNLTTLKSILPYFGRINKNGGIFFIDEIHRASKLAQELCYTALEDCYLDSGGGRPKLQLKPFTLIAATTQSGSLLLPLYDRFVHKYNLYLYSIEDLSSIIKKSCNRLSIRLDENAVRELAQRGRGIPRVVNNYLVWIRDFVVSKNIGVVTSSILTDCMRMIAVDPNGLDSQDKLYIDALRKSSPAGLNTLVASLGLSKDTIEHNIEPFLLQQGKIIKTSKGRVLV